MFIKTFSSLAPWHDWYDHSFYLIEKRINLLHTQVFLFSKKYDNTDKLHLCASKESFPVIFYINPILFYYVYYY